jgi:hypothetical protein
MDPMSGSGRVNLNLPQIQISRYNDYLIGSQLKGEAKKSSLKKTTKKLLKPGFYSAEDGSITAVSEQGDLLTISREGLDLSAYLINKVGR